MLINRKKHNLCQNTINHYGNKSNEYTIGMFKDIVSDIKGILNRFVEADFDSLSNAEFYNLISNIYDISLEKEDIFKFFSDKNNKKYDRIVTIPTTMVYTVNNSSGFFDDSYQVFYEAMIDKDVSLDSNKVYSKIQLKKMLKNKDIVITNTDSILIDERLEKEEEYEDINKNNSLVPKNVDYSDKESFYYFIKEIRSILDNKRILNDLNDYVLDFNQELYNIYVYSSLHTVYSNIMSQCISWFDNSDTKEEVQVLTKRIENQKKELYN